MIFELRFEIEGTERGKEGNNRGEVEILKEQHTKSKMTGQDLWATKIKREGKEREKEGKNRGKGKD